jgi:hypothetical protein
MSDYPYHKEGHVIEQARRMGADIHDINSNLYGMRQLSIATVLSVPEDHVLYKVNIVNAGQFKKSDAYLLADPNQWNIVGYPEVNDVVLLMHQRGGGDAHIIMRLQDKRKKILTNATLINNDGMTPGAHQP